MRSRAVKTRRVFQCYNLYLYNRGYIYMVLFICYCFSGYRKCSYMLNGTGVEDLERSPMTSKRRPEIIRLRP
ncbi:hypothetical protein BDQ17DRAFT_621912 [Cyathus striatus]|nr:hypothetical protein BDQ17DRAFT_621912 [Cyathus striatus]